MVPKLLIEELECLTNVRNILINENMIACTKCRYCIDGCPKHIDIPEFFSLYNAKKIWRAWGTESRYKEFESKPSDCIKCGKCENICPQHLRIRDLLVNVKELFNE